MSRGVVAPTTVPYVPSPVTEVKQATSIMIPGSVLYTIATGTIVNAFSHLNNMSQSFTEGLG